VQAGGRVGLVTHDWGAYLGYLLEQAHPEMVAKMAALDVGGQVEPKGLKETLMIVGYQWALIACWLAGGITPPLGGLLSRAVARVIRFWRNSMLPWKRSGLLTRYRPLCPVLYLYGAAKPLMFHSPRWLRVVADSGGRAEGIAGAGHWLMETHARTVNDQLGEWFRDLQHLD
jgi:pimeloyl-ACP methyl ester carboxylesterase